MWQQLIDVLDKICNIYDEIARLGEEKRIALVNVNRGALSKILEQEKIITSQIQSLENQRVLIIQELSKNTPNLKSTFDFYSIAPTPFVRKKLEELHYKLSQNVERALQIREYNQILAKTALDNVTFKLNRISGAFVEPTYGNKGSVITHRKNFDYQA